MSEPCEVDFIPLKRAARYLFGKPYAALRMSKNKLTISVSPWTAISGKKPSLEKKYYGFGGSDWESHSEIWITTSELDILERGRNGVPRNFNRHHSGPSLRTIYMDLGIPLTVEVQSEN